MSGILFGVGVGPGDPELMTIKAIKTIKKCDVLVFPGKNRETSLSYQIAKGMVVDIDDKPSVALSFPMSNDSVLLANAHKDASAKIIDILDAKMNVAFLTLGDPTIFSTFTYVKRIVEEKGYKTEMVNGISSFSQAAALLNNELAIEGETIHIIPMAGGTKSTHEGNNSVKQNTQKTLDQIEFLEGTIVLMKASANYDLTRQFIIEHGYTASMVSNAGLENEAVYKGVENFPMDTDYFSIIIIKK